MLQHNVIEESIDLNGQKLTLQIGKYAPQTDVSIYAQLGDTVVLLTLAIGQETEMDYFPLSVEYIEKYYAGGIIKGSQWVKREGRPSDEAILHGRFIDRGIRPLFPKYLRYETQVIATVLSVDGVNAPEIVAAIAASAAIALSKLPWKGPVSTCRVGYVHANGYGDGYIVNPTHDQRKLSSLDLVMTSTKDRVVMIETGAEELSEDILMKAIEYGHQENIKIINFIEGLVKKAGQPKIEAEQPSKKLEVVKLIHEHYQSEVDAIATERATKEHASGNATGDLIKVIKKAYEDLYDSRTIADAIEYASNEYVRSLILDKNKRIDGRGFEDVRELTIETGMIPRTHGSAIFQRGLTQVLSVTTLASSGQELMIEGLEGNEAKRYMHHYNALPFCYGEAGRLGSPGRREIGHGALAEKALEAVLPSPEEFPYVMRVVSEVLSSNGSTSMASTCGSTLALLDAGVPLKNPVAGISIGLVERSESDYKLLVDIIGMEDFAGDMDFKVAGSKEGITAIQLDVKNTGLTSEMIKQTLELARKTRMFLLEKMAAVIPGPKAMSAYAPKVVVLTPPEDKIGAIIGPGGKNIRHITTSTGAEVNVSDDGKVSVSGRIQESVDKAVELIKSLYTELEVGGQYVGTVKSILPFGAVVEFMPGREGLLHISKMGTGFVKNVTDVMNVGDAVTVKVDETDGRGRISLSLIAKK